MSTTSESGYLHGFDLKEQDRLYAQAAFLDPFIFERLDLTGIRHLLEAGCGVGAMTGCLLQRWPTMRITGMDLSATQLERARRHLAAIPGAIDRIDLIEGDAASIHLNPNLGFDGAFICWVLEHVPNAPGFLASIRAALTPGARVFVTEVVNHSLFVHPHGPTLEEYWRQYNAHQIALGGDPDVGARLGSLLDGAGFKAVRTWVHCFMWDRRDPLQRRAMFNYWFELMESGSVGLIESGRITRHLVDQVAGELRQLQANPESIFFYTFAQATARV